jgi:hypothetical protein
MSAMIVIYGASDDLIEVVGRVRGCDEYLGGDEGRAVVLDPTGDVFRVTYGPDGRAVWRVDHVTISGSLRVEIERAPDGDDPDPYTDRATVTGDIDRVRVFDSWPPTDQEVEERVLRKIEDGLADHETRAVWEALGRP